MYLIIGFLFSGVHEWHKMGTQRIYLKSFNSLAPEKFELNFRHVIFKQILVIDGWPISCEIALIWMSLDIIWANVDSDPCRQMASLGLNELTHWGLI